MDKMECKQLIWYDHINRMDNARVPKRMLQHREVNSENRGKRKYKRQ